MKKILLTIAAIALFAAPVSAQMMSVWADAEMASCEVFGTAYVTFPVFLMLEPGPDGAFAAEYRLSVPAGLLVQVTNPAADISVAMGDATNGAGISIGFLSCRTETAVVYDFVMFPMDAVPAYIMVEPNADTGKLIVATCEEPLRPEIPCAVYNYFGWNDACVVGTKESSWGAIKSLMD